jgi:hypothetical protein
MCQGFLDYITWYMCFIESKLGFESLKAVRQIRFWAMSLLSAHTSKCCDMPYAFPEHGILWGFIYRSSDANLSIPAYWLWFIFQKDECVFWKEYEPKEWVFASVDCVKVRGLGIKFIRQHFLSGFSFWQLPFSECDCKAQCFLKR